MIFVETRTAEHYVEPTSRLALLEALRAKGHLPLIRSARLHCFDLALAGEAEGAGDTGGAAAGRAAELERAVAEWQDAEGDDPYVRGELFCSADHAFFLIFSDSEEAAEAGRLRAGIVHTGETFEPARKLEAFCRDVRGACEKVAPARPGEDNDETLTPFEWEPREEARGAADSGQGGGAGPSDFPADFGADGAPAFAAAEGDRVAELLEDAAVRGFLQRLSEAHAGGGAGESSAPPGRDAEHEAMAARLSGAGLIRREVQVSCRKDGRSLFRLPSAEALGMVTASNAVCSECGLAIADERAEELLTSTPLAASMLRDGSWLLGRMRGVVAALGVPGRDVRISPAGEESEARLVARVCGEQFLFVLHDGDFTGAQARRALEAGAETQAARLVVVSTGRVHDDARARLRDFARRRTRAGGETEVHFVEGVEHAGGELSAIVERVSRQALARELFELDAAAGFNVGHMLATRFALAARGASLVDLAASAANAAAGGLGEY